MYVGQVSNLLQLFVEVERTGRHNQFYEKFEVRQDIGRILSALSPAHPGISNILSQIPPTYHMFVQRAFTDIQQSLACP